MINFVKKTIGIVSFLIAGLCTLGLLYPTHSMTFEEVLKGKSVFAFFGFLFALLSYYLLKNKK